MGNNAAASMSPATLDSGKPRVISIGSGVLPEDISSIVAEYLSNGSSDYVKAALSGVQPITLCLAQDPSSLLTKFWSLGLVSLERHRDLLDFKIDKKFSITDQKACLDFLEQKNSSYCRIVTEVFIVQLYMDDVFGSNPLENLRNTIRALQGHLKQVKHVVISVEDSACCVFSLKDVICTATGLRQSVDQSEVLFEIIDDLQTCYKKNFLNEKEVFAFYFKSNVPRKSEKYLANYAVWVHYRAIRDLFDKEASHIVSNKIMWVMSIQRNSCEVNEPNCSRFCRVFHWDGTRLLSLETNRYYDFKEHVFCFKDNPFIERIVMNYNRYGKPLQLPRPSAPLTDNSRKSALIELTLTGDSYAIDLTDLNNGYFPHLRHLCIIGGDITGHLDSDRVPLLETLRIEPGIELDESSSKEGHPLIRDRVYSLLHRGRPWQLVATQSKGSWSLASYDQPIANPHDEVKMDSPISSSSPHSLTLIKELLLVANSQNDIDEWHTQLKGFSSLEAAVDDHRNRLLVWEPQSVEKIVVLCVVKGIFPRLEFTEAIHKQPCILTSLECYFVSVDIDGVALPKLQTLEVNWGLVKLSAAFPHLQRLSLYETTLNSPWQVETPFLQSLNCYKLKDGQRLSICPNWLLKLSSLQIVLFEDDPTNCPVISDMSGLGFSHLMRVVFGNNMALTPFYNQCRVHKVSHLELTLNALQLPVGWHDSFRHCETLTISVCALTPEDSKSKESLIEVRLPFCPRVKTLAVTEENCRVLLDSEIPNLTVCSLPSPKSLGRNLSCPALKRIRFTEKLSDVEKELCLNQATYVAIGAQPREIILAADYQLHTIA